MSTLTTSPPSTNGTGGTVAKAPPTTVKGWLNDAKVKEQIAKALPTHLTADRMIRVALTTLLTNPKIGDCEPMSVVECLLKCSQLGLEPDNRRAYLIPFSKSIKINGKWEKTLICTLVVGYMGLAELVYRSGIVSYLHADLVREGDIFEFNKGELVEHIPWFLRKDPLKPTDCGKVYATYALARMKDGSEKVDVLSIGEVYSIRDDSEGWKAFKSGAIKKSPWDPAKPVSEGEMIKKTAFRRLSKWLPLSPEIRDQIRKEDDQTLEPEFRRLPDRKAGETNSDHLEKLLADRQTADSSVDSDDSRNAGTDDSSDTSNTSGLDQSDEATQTREPGDDDGSVPVGNQFSEKGAVINNKIAAAVGDYDKLVAIIDDIVALYKDKVRCVDPEGRWLHSRLDDEIALAKPKKK